MIQPFYQSNDYKGYSFRLLQTKTCIEFNSKSYIFIQSLFLLHFCHSLLLQHCVDYSLRTQCLENSQKKHNKMTKDPTIIHGCYKLATLILQRIFLRESLSQILSYDMYLYIMIDVRMCCLIQQVTTITKLFCHQIAFDDLSLKNKTRVATSRTSFNS